MKSKTPKSKANILAALCLFFALSLQLVVRVEVTSRSYLLEKVRESALRNDQKLRMLKLNYGWLTSPSIIQKKAMHRYGLKNSQKKKFREL